MSCNNYIQYIEKFNKNDEEIVKQMIPNSNTTEWIANEVPRFECPDKLLEETYYFRWWVFRKHIKETEEGRIITEFLPTVKWAGPHNSINCANGHHLSEARWLRSDHTLAKEYIRFWLQGSGNESSYSSWIADAVYQYVRVTGDILFACEMLHDLIRYYDKVEESNLTRYGLFWSYDDRDAMEMSISGSGLRPTLNSYMYANAKAISAIADWAGEQHTAHKYSQKAENLRKRILEILWDSEAGFFKVIPQQNRNDTIQNLKFDTIPLENNVCEAIGFIPWCFGIPNMDYDIAWKRLSDKQGFYSAHGITTAEQSHPGFMKHCPTHECLWNGPIWPFATTQVIYAMLEYLQTHKSHRLNSVSFMKQITTYAKSHYRIRKDGIKVNWLDENIDPTTGEWLSRKILESWNWPESKAGYERGKDYNHSAFCDLIIRGVCGIRPLDENRIRLQPLLPDGYWNYFLLEGLPYCGRLLTVGYDADGTRYNKGIGLWIESDGCQVAINPRLAAMDINL